MTVISEIDEYGINTNIKVRYQTDRIYVSQHCSLSAVSLQSLCSLSAVCLQSFCSRKLCVIELDGLLFSEDLHWYDPGGGKPLPSAEHLRAGQVQHYGTT